MVAKRKIDKLGVSTSLLGFGVMRLPVINGEDSDIDIAETEKMFDAAIANGVNYFDTARMYHGGNSEAVMGELLRKYPRESLYYATKLPMWHVNEEADIYDIFEDQLKKLQTDYIDFYLIHGVDQGQLAKIKEFKVLEKLAQLKKEGKIRNIGFSFHDKLPAFKEALDVFDWDFCMIQLSYINTDRQQGIEGYNLLAEKEIPTIIMEPVNGGKLTSFNDEISALFKPFNSDNASFASFAFRWLANLPNVKVILSGMSNMEQLTDNIKTLTNPKPVSAEENEMLKRVKDMLENAVAVGCTRCNYCMPCPADVNIVASINSYNDYYLHNDPDRIHGFMTMSRNNKRNPEQCTDCGECAAKCPQKIDIPKILKEVVELEKTI
jgi:predicted aldo/keto reductase-like oxidoreductase